MKVFYGVQDILDQVNSLPEVGFFYIKPTEQVNSKNDLLNTVFYLPENHDDEDQLEEDGITDCWLEAPTFCDIIENILDHRPNAKEDDFICAILHYWKHDDFLD